MRAEIKLITPEFAKKLLEMNVGNRRLKTVKNLYKNQMLKGLWKENGEPIIIDVNGFIKDGQHRLNAVIEANYSYTCPIIYDVDPNVMDTIDTGSNRSLGDVLELNGFYSPLSSAAILKAIHVINKNENTYSTVPSKEAKAFLSNNEGLALAFDVKDDLHKLVKTSRDIYRKQTISILNQKEIASMIYTIKRFDYDFNVVKFMNLLVGNEESSNSCTNWLYRKLLSAKVNKAPLNNLWKRNAIVKLWNIYSLGNDAPIRHIKVSLDVLEKSNSL